MPDASPTEATSSTTAVDGPVLDAATVEPNVFSCRNDGDCVATPFPACSQQLRQCVVCTLDEHCNSEKPHCWVAASDELNRCIECQSGSDCVSGLCENDVCVACNPNTNQGCDDGICLKAANESPHCVACGLDADCQTGVCVENQCLACDVSTNRGCDLGTYCLPRSEVLSIPDTDAGVPDASAWPDSNDAVCVECAPSKPCADPDHPVCLNNVCVTCDPAVAIDNGCKASTPHCLAGSVLTDAGSSSMSSGTSNSLTISADSGPGENRCVECVESSDCENAHCVDYVCQPCDPDTYAGCADGGICVPRQMSEGVTSLAYECLECNDDKPCAGDLHCGSDGKCYECVESSDCSSAKPYCQSNGECGPCREDKHCSPNTYCAPEGVCVECVTDEHCAGSAAGHVCYAPMNTCVECTESNLDACEGKPCNVLLGSSNAFTCYDDEDTVDGGLSTECQRCTDSEDCDGRTECVALGESDLRCVPLAVDSQERTDCAVTELEGLDGETRAYCIPFGC